MTVVYKEPFAPSTRGDAFGNNAPYRNGHKHRGMDWHPGELKAIPAVCNGVVHNIFWSSVLGNVIEILAADGVYTQYAHLAKKPLLLKKGSKIKLGQSIGKVGGGPKTPSGSASTGAHCHISMARVPDGHLAPYAKLIDPLKYILAHQAA